MNTYRISVALLICTALASVLTAQVPSVINYQGSVSSGGGLFNGTGRFKFALVSGQRNVSYWSNDGSSIQGGEPVLSVPIEVSRGVFSVNLGDTTLSNMTAAISPSIFTNIDVRLRIWFSDGRTPFQQMVPDQRFTSVGYAMVAASVTDGAIPVQKLAARPVVSDVVVPAGGIGLSRSSGIFDTSSNYPNFVDVPNLEVTIETTGRPVWMTLTGREAPPANVNGSSIYVEKPTQGDVASGIFALARDGAIISRHEMLLNPGSGELTWKSLWVPPSSVTYLDQPPPGRHTYKVQVAATTPGARIGLNYCVLVVYEL